MWYTWHVAAKRKEAPAAEPALPPTEVTHGKRVPGIFFRTESGGEPLREWLKSLPPEDRIARVLFYIDAKGRMVLLHGFIKKTQKTPLNDLELARKNKSKHERGLSQ
jgi:hypothetical protein